MENKELSFPIKNEERHPGMWDQARRLRCKDGYIPTIVILLFREPIHVLRSLFTEDKGPLGIVPLLVYGVYYYFGSCFLCGCCIAHGIFIPHIVTGAVWGRLCAETIQHVFPGSKPWANPNKFAFLCGAAQLSGSLHLTYTISMMMLESCNSTHMAVPLCIVVCFAKFVASIFNSGIYETQAYAGGVPLLAKEAPPMPSSTRASNVMASPVQTVPMNAKYGDLINILNKTKHNGFPVVESQQTSSENGTSTFGQLKGLIQRSHIVAIINNQLNADKLAVRKNLKMIRQALYNSDTLNEVESAQKSLNNFGVAATESSFHQIRKEDENIVVNLQPFMNHAPYIINQNASLSQTYLLFSNLGIRHLVVVNNNLKVVGIITRKDLSVFRYHAHFLRGETIVVPLK